jgi:glycosyltransferase involved in cell wall biosynthesis
MTRPLVTISIPTYNAERTLGETLASILKQTYEDIEIHISDNASTDGTLAVVASFDDPRIHIHQHATNIGGEANFQYCMSLGRGKYTAIYHADDVYDPHMVERQVAFLEAHPEAGAVCTSGYRVDDEGTILSTFELPPSLRGGAGPRVFHLEEAAHAVFEHGNFVVCPSVMARAEVYQHEVSTWNRGQFGTSADLDVWLRILENHGFGYLPERLIRYRHGQSHASFFINRLRTTKMDMLLVLEHYLEKPSWQRFITDADRRNVRRQIQADRVKRASNAIVKSDFACARQLLGEVEPGPLFTDAGRGLRDALVLATWVLVHIGLSARPLVLPVLRRIAAR